MFHVISKKDVENIRMNVHHDAECLGLPEMTSLPWEFDRDYAKAGLWARFCLDYVLPKEATHIVLGWMDADGKRTLLRCPEVYTEKGFKNFCTYVTRSKFQVVYVVHAH